MPTPKERWWTICRGGWWYGIVFTHDEATGAETRVYESVPWRTKQEAVYDLLLWLHYQRGHRHPGPWRADSKRAQKKNR